MVRFEHEHKHIRQENNTIEKYFVIPNCIFELQKNQDFFQWHQIGIAGIGRGSGGGIAA